MDTFSIVMMAAAAVCLVLYIMRRRARLSQED